MVVKVMIEGRGGGLVVEMPRREGQGRMVSGCRPCILCALGVTLTVFILSSLPSIFSDRLPFLVSISGICVLMEDSSTLKVMKEEEVRILTNSPAYIISNSK